jgi:hypothetical protein
MAAGDLDGEARIRPSLPGLTRQSIVRAKRLAKNYGPAGSDEQMFGVE